MSSAGVINQVLTAPKLLLELRIRDIHTNACTHAHTCTLALKKYSKQVQKHFEKMKRM